MPSKDNKQNEMKNLILGIDLGSEFIRGVITNDDGFVKCYEVKSDGIEFGVIIDYDLVRNALIKLFLHITRDFKFFPRAVSVVSGSINIGYTAVVITHFTKRPNGIISIIDIEDIEREAIKKINNISGKTILYRKIVKNTIDGKEIVGDIVGIYGKRIDSKVFFVYDDMRQADLIYEIFKSLEIEIDIIVPGMLADAAAVLNKKDRKLGAMSLNIGSETSSYIYYESNIPVMLGVIKYGGENLTSELALNMRINIDDAEDLKKDLSLRKEIGKDKKITELLSQRLADLARVLDGELVKINRSGLIPGGITLSGGSSRLNGIENVFKYEMKIPVNNYLKNIQSFSPDNDLDSEVNINSFDSNRDFLISDAVFTRGYGATKFVEDIGEVEVYNRVFSFYIEKIKNFLNKISP